MFILTGADCKTGLSLVKVRPSRTVGVAFIFFVTTLLEGNTSFSGIIRTAMITKLRIKVLMLSESLKDTIVFFTTCLIVVCITSEGIKCLTLNLTNKSTKTIITCRLFNRIHREIAT